MSKKKSTATKQEQISRTAERAAAIRKEHEAKERRRRTLVVTGVAVVVLALIFGIGYAVQSSRDSTGQVATAPSGVADGYAVPVGEPSAPVEVTIYEDFMCPYCGQFEAASHDALARYVDQGDVLVKYHVVSFLDRASDGTKYSTRAMNALGVVLDSAGPEAAKKFHDSLYQNQPEESTPGLSDAQLIDFAVEAGAQESDVAGPITSVKFEQWVQNAGDAASKAKINSTPTVMVDGEPVTGTTIDGMVTEMVKRIDAKLAS